MPNRLGQFQKILFKKSLDGFIVTNSTNIFYLTGFKGISETEREAILIVSPNPTLITARLYQNQAKNLATEDLKIEIVAERNHLFDLVQKLLKNRQRVGFEEDDLKFAEFKKFKKLLPGLKLFPQKNLVEDLRAIKTPDEIKKIAKAQIISQKAFAKLVKTLETGQTEAEIAHKLEAIIRSLGAGETSFKAIVASGPNSGFPHHQADKRKIKRGDLLLLDFGAKYQNYCADLSRTIIIGPASDQIFNIFDHVKAAQNKAFNIIRHGLAASNTYHAANNHFKKQGLDRHFLHGLGHGVGLAIHEKPYLRAKLSDKLVNGMVFSLEPGLYFPWGGVRIEDLVVIENGKPKVLGQTQDKLIQIG